MKKRLVAEFTIPNLSVTIDSNRRLFKKHEPFEDHFAQVQIHAEELIGLNRNVHPFPTIIKEIEVKLNIPTHPTLLK